ncbi:VWA domain-containing protein [Rossellomorea sp. SC111]|uniref:vWA domain-containing protein n=1 Tax=Rossellomorea sp. SC111 TaxID=2968985 RepID=UPI00215ADAD6|nr:VWA domain-containing protein [Rossellomorea sp. SC111]MCR8850838.1 VWA domain-containing protein [Rossellomorea sp. SC111]
MNRLKVILQILIVLSIFMVGCGNENKEDQTTQKNTSQKVDDDNNPSKKATFTTSSNEEVEVAPLPSTYQELEDLPAGKDSERIPTLTEEDKDKVAERFKDLPDIQNNPSKKELDFYYQELLKRVQRDFKGPESLIKQMKFQSFGDPEIEDTRYQFKENLNVEIILDASGSMAQDVGGTTKMDAAKEEIKRFVESLPEGTKIGLRVYGHKGSNADSDKELSCNSSEMIYSIEPIDESKFQSAVDQVQPTGWTPITLALNEAKKDLSTFKGDNNNNIVYLVSDGIETCDQDPVAAAKELYDSNLKPIINVIGFNVDTNGQRQLKDIADATEGIYENVDDQESLKSELEKIQSVAEAWEKWKSKGKQSIELKEVQNSLDIFGYITQESVKVTTERTQIDLFLSILADHGKMDTESNTYLSEKNRVYHEWMYAEVEEFEQELRAINEKSYKDAMKALEQKYNINTQ